VVVIPWGGDVPHAWWGSGVVRQTRYVPSVGVDDDNRILPLGMAGGIQRPRCLHG
jgi:hypothetical protein